MQKLLEKFLFLCAFLGAGFGAFADESKSSVDFGVDFGADFAKSSEKSSLDSSADFAQKSSADFGAQSNPLQNPQNLQNPKNLQNTQNSKNPQILQNPQTTQNAQIPQSPHSKHSLLLLYENDSNFIPHIDRYYTAGISLKFHSKDLPNSANSARTGFYKFMHALSLSTFFAKHLPKYHDDEIFAPSFGISLAQEMYAPHNDNKFTPNPPKDDHPYGGFLYASVILQNRFKYIVEQFEAQVGIVGKYALAKQAQDIIHEARNVRKLEGWETQLKNEGVFNLFYNLSFSLPKVYEKSRHILDIMPQASFALGNAKIHAQANLVARIGYNLAPNTFAPTINSGFVSSAKNAFGFSIEAYMGGGIRAVVRNMFLQGNSFLPRNEVDLYRGVGEFIWGVSLNYKRFFVAYTAIARTKEFASQNGGGWNGIHTFGSIVLGGNF